MDNQQRRQEEEKTEQCSRCNSKDVALYLITMPPEIMERTLFCKPCLLTAVDNVNQKNKVKQKDTTNKSVS